MVLKKQHLMELIIFLIILRSFEFIGLNIDRAISTAFTYTAITWAILLVIEIAVDKKIEYPIISTKPQKSLINAVIGYAALIIGTAIITNIPNQPFSLINITTTLSVLTFAEAGQGILAGNVIFLSIIFGILIPIIETQAGFVRPLEFITKQVFKKDPQTIKLPRDLGKVLGISLILMALFTITHLTAKAAVSTINLQQSLLIVLLFSIITVTLIIIDKSGQSAILLHIIANLVSITTTLGTTTPILSIIISIATAYLAIQITTNKKIFGRTT